MFRNLLHTFTSRIISAVAAFTLVILSTQHLGAEGRGYVGLILTSVANVLLLNGFIGGAALVYLLPQHKTRGYLHNVLFLSYGWTLLQSACLVAIFYWAQLVPRDQLLHIGLLGILSSITAAHGNVFVAFEAIVLFNLTTLFQNLLQVMLFGLMIWLFPHVDIAHFVLCLYCGYFFSFLFSSIQVRRLYLNLEQADKEISWRALFVQVGGYGFVSQLGNVLQYLNYRLSYYVLHQGHHLADIGLYDIGIRLAEAVWMISNSLSTVLYSRVANLGDNEISRRLTLLLAKLSLLTALAVALVLCFVPIRFFTILFGAEFGAVRTIVRLLSLGIIVFSFSTIVSHYIAGIGRYAINTLASAVGLIITLTGNLYLVPRWGVVGAGATASLSYLLTAVLTTLFFCRQAGLPWYALLPTWRDLRYVRDIFIKRM